MLLLLTQASIVPLFSKVKTQNWVKDGSIFRLLVTFKSLPLVAISLKSEIKFETLPSKVKESMVP